MKSKVLSVVLFFTVFPLFAAETLPEPSTAMLTQVARLKAKGIPLTDYHIHIRGGMTPEKALDWMKKTGVRSGVLENVGKDWPLSDNAKLKAFIDDAARFPELPIGIQVNDRDLKEIEAVTVYFDPPGGRVFINERDGIAGRRIRISRHVHAR